MRKNQKSRYGSERNDNTSNSVKINTYIRQENRNESLLSKVFDGSKSEVSPDMILRLISAIKQI